MCSKGEGGRNNYRSARSASLLSGPQFHLRPILDCGEARKKGLLWLVAQEIRCDPFRLETGQDGRAKSGKGPEELLWGAAAFILSNLSQCEWFEGGEGIREASRYGSKIGLSEREKRSRWRSDKKHSSVR